MRQTRERIDHGNTHSPGKIVSLFEPHTEIIRKGKAGKPTEFGKMVKIQEAEQQIVTHYEVYDAAAQRLRPAGPRPRSPRAAVRPRAPPGCGRCGLLLGSQRSRRARTRRQARLDPQPQHQERRTQGARRSKRWFRKAQKWRTGCEGRISLLKRRHGLNRCRYKGPAGMRRWVGLGVIADNLINIGRALAASAKR